MERTDLKVRLKFAGLQPAAPAMDLTHLASAIAAQSAAAPAVAGAGSGDAAGSDPGGCGSGG